MALAGGAQFGDDSASGRSPGDAKQTVAAVVALGLSLSNTQTHINIFAAGGQVRSLLLPSGRERVRLSLYLAIATVFDSRTNQYFVQRDNRGCNRQFTSSTLSVYIIF